MLLQAILSGFVAALITVALVPVVATLARFANAVDTPGGRRDHHLPIPRLGGVAILTGIAAGVLFGVLVSAKEVLGSTPAEEISIFSLALLIVFLAGSADDLFSLSVATKLAVQVIAASLMVGAGWTFQELQVPFWGVIDLGAFAPLVSILWIVGITNAINLLDGIDGLASGVSAIIAGSFLLLALFHGHPGTVLVSAAMAGACVGFLHHNWSPAKIFMGDSGSLTLGFLLASISLHSSLKTPAAVAVMVPILALGLPAIDTLLVMVVRFLDSPGHPLLRRLAMMFQADRRHLHHLLLHLAPQRGSIVLGLYAVASLFCFMAVAVAMSRNSLLGYALLVIEVGVVLLIRQAGFRARAREFALAQRSDVRDHLGALEEQEQPSEPILARQRA